MREPTGMKAMKFVLEKVTDSGVRLGKMVWWTGNKRSIIETPLCLPLTRGGAIPHLVQSGYHEISHRPSAAMLTLPSLYNISLVILASVESDSDM